PAHAAHQRFVTYFPEAALDDPNFGKADAQERCLRPYKLITHRMLRLKRSSRHAICNAHRRKNTPTNIQQRGIIMKKIIVTLACCALIAPLAFAQTGSTHKKQKTTTEEPITVTGKIIQTTTQEGAA